MGRPGRRETLLEALPSGRPWGEVSKVVPEGGSLMKCRLNRETALVSLSSLCLEVSALAEDSGK